MTIHVEAGMLLSVALVVGGFIVALARQLSGLTADVIMLCAAQSTERAERLAADQLEATRREAACDHINERVDTLHTKIGPVHL